MTKFEEFCDSLIQELPRAVKPELPYKRELTKLESIILRERFSKYAHPGYVDDFGRIMLGNGIDSEYTYFIEPSDLIMCQT